MYKKLITIDNLDDLKNIDNKEKYIFLDQLNTFKKKIFIVIQKFLKKIKFFIKKNF